MKPAKSIVWLAIAWLAVFAVLFEPRPARAAEPDSKPILRVETGMHTSLIRRLVVDAPRNRIFTAGDDKTIRVWQLPEQRLIATLRVPIDKGHEGQVFALAVSPDGHTVAAGGWTGWDWDGTASIYFFDVVSGDMTRRIGGFRDAIASLIWSPDGKHIAVGLQGQAGLDIISAADGKVVAQDKQYLDKLMDMDLSREGRIIAASLDGMVRLYDRKFNLKGRRKIPGGLKPIAVKFSPDGSRFAVAFAHTPVVAVASARNMEVLFHVDTKGLKDQAAFLTLAWSSDGEWLYAGGDYRGKGLNPLYRWGDKGRGARERIPVVANRIPEIQQLPDGQIAFAAEDPGFGVLGPDGKVAKYRGPDVIDYAAAHSRLLVSHDGLSVAYPVKRDGSEVHHFAALAGGDQNPAEASKGTYIAPITEADEIQISNWRNRLQPVINGKTPRFDDYEMIRTYAIAPDKSAILLGTEWALRLLDVKAKQLWSVSLAAVAWAVNISPNGRLAIAALSDGTIRWYRLRDGAEVFSYFPHRNGKDWIAWIPSGYYVSSVYGDNFIGWHINRGKDVAPDFHRAVQFDRILYRPDVIRSKLKSYSSASNLKIPEPRQKADFNINRMAEIAPPRLKIRLGKVEITGGRAELSLHLKGEANSLDMKDVTVFVNNLPVTPTRQRALSGADTRAFSRSLKLPLANNINNVRVEAFNGFSMGVAEAYLALPKSIEVVPQKGDLYLLAIGVNEFTKLGEDAELAYAAQDA